MRSSDWSSDVCSSDLLVADRKSRPTNYAVCVISEGARLSSDDGKSGGDISKSATQRDDIGVGQRLAPEIEARTGPWTVVPDLASLMRAGTPDALDRLGGFVFGGLAIQLPQQGTSGRRVALQVGNSVPLPGETPL